MIREEKPVPITSYLIAYLIAAPVAITSAVLLRFVFTVPRFISYSVPLLILFSSTYFVARREPKRRTFHLAFTLPAILVTLQTAVFYLID